MLVLIVTFNLACFYFGFSLGLKTYNLAFLPILVALYLHKKKVMDTVFVVIFILFFIGMIASVIGNFSLAKQLSELFYVGAYLLLVFVLLGKMKSVQLSGFVSWYLVTVFLIVTFLVFQIFTSLNANFQDSVIFTLTVIKGVILLVMAFLAFAVYLSRETIQSIIFLMVVCCFIFSDILSFITTSYIQFWAFEAIHGIFQGVGLILTLAYVFNCQKITDKAINSKVYRSLSKSPYFLN